MAPCLTKSDALRDEVLVLLRAKGAHPMSLRDIQHLLKVPPGGKRDLQSLLRRLCESGDLVRTRGKRFGVSAEMNLAPGRLQMHPDGYGFVVLDEKATGDVFVKARELAGAMHGTASSCASSRRSPAAAAPRAASSACSQRARASVVGRIERTGEYAYLTPADPRLTQDVFIPDGRVGEAQTGQMVVAEITAWPAARRPAEATVVEVLGDEGAPGVAEEVIIRQFDLPHRFPRRVLLDAETVPAEVGAPERAGRSDLRGMLTVTIDGETARDFDDAISLELTPKGTWLLRVHIADVSHYVPEGGAMDREAFARGTSIYFPGRVLPMLPERLSNGICSLNPGVDRLAFTAVLEFSRQGKVLNHDFLETVIHSDARLTYTAVARALEGGDPAALPEVPGLAAMLEQARELALAIRAQRARRGSIDFDLPEEQILLDLQGSITTIVRSERNVAHRIIEEFMIAANEAVAGYFGWMKVPGHLPGARGPGAGEARRLRGVRGGVRPQDPPPPRADVAVSRRLHRDPARAARGARAQRGAAAQHEAGGLRGRQHRALRAGEHGLHALHLADPPLSRPGRAPAAARSGAPRPFHRRRTRRSSRPRCRRSRRTVRRANAWRRRPSAKWSTCTRPSTSRAGSGRRPPASSPA